MNSRRQADLEPLVILAFDETRTFAKPRDGESWSHFSEFRRVLYALRDQPLFSLFLSTTGNIQALSTSRLFIEIGFDHFAFKDQFDLRTVTNDEHICHFGRPLCVSSGSCPQIIA